MNISFLIKATAILVYWFTGLHLIFTDWGQPRFIFGVMNILEATGVLFLLAAAAMFYAWGLLDTPKNRGK